MVLWDLRPTRAARPRAVGAEIDRRGAVGEVALLRIEAGVRGGASRPSRDDELLRLLEDLEMELGMKTVRRGEELFVSPTRGDERAIRPRR